MRVVPLRAEDLDAALPLFAGYQRFYGVDDPDDDRNRAFLQRFLAPSDDGLLIGAWLDGELVGFATLYWTFSSTRAAEIALLNDLYVAEHVRGRQVGRALLLSAAEAARQRGLKAMEWLTHVDNRTAQRLYERIEGARRDAWFGYEIDLPSP